MSWTLLLALAALVFFNRYVFLEPAMPVRLPELLREALKYSAPCLLIAICGPIILLHDGEVRGVLSNAYLYGALAGVLIALKVRSMVLSVLLILSTFYLFSWLLG